MEHRGSSVTFNAEKKNKKLSHMPKEIPLNYCLMVKSTAAERERHGTSHPMHFSLPVAALRHQSFFDHLSNGQTVPKPEPESLLPWSLGRPGSPRINSPMHAQFSPQKSNQSYSSSLSSSLNSSLVRRKCSSILWLPKKLWSSASELKKKKKIGGRHSIIFNLWVHW